MKGKIIGWLDSIALVILVLCMCTQLDVGAIGRNTLSQGFATKQLFIAVPDVALLAIFVWFVVRTTTLKSWKKLWWPPLPCWALVICMALSVVYSKPLVNAVMHSLQNVHGLTGMLKAILTTKEFKEALANSLQWSSYFVLAPLIFVNLIYDQSGEKVLLRRTLAIVTFAIGAGLAIAINVWPYIPLQSLPQIELSKLWFSSPNAYSGFLAISLPLLMGAILGHRSSKVGLLWFTWLLGMLALIAALFTMFAMWSIVALFLGVVLTGFIFRARARTATLVILAFIFAMALWPKQGGKQFTRFNSWRIPSETQFVKKQYIEWFVAARRTADVRTHAFASGIGTGNYQFSIGSYYARLPNEEKMPPDSNNIYLVQAVSIGILGLAAFLWIWGYFFNMARLAFKINRQDWLGAAVMGSLIAFLFVNLFHAMIVRGVGIVLAFVLSLAIVAKMQADQKIRERDAAT